MSFRLTLLVLCDRPESYSNLVSAFSAVNVELLMAHDLPQAESVLLKQRVHGILLRHDRKRDHRRLANRLKRVTPQLPIFLLTDQSQLKQREINSIWRGDFKDETITRAMAEFFSKVFRPSTMFGTGMPVVVGPKLRTARANGSRRAS